MKSNPLLSDITRHTNIFIVLSAVVLGALTFFFGQRMEVFGSLGDERIYAVLTANVDGLMAEKQLDDYRLQRVLPTALVHYTMKVLGKPFLSDQMVGAFGAYNIMLAGLSAWIWCLIAGELKVSVRGKWLGFIALFCHFHFLKFVPYVQVTTDMFAYTVTLALVYFYLKNNPVGLTAMIILGAFCWPTVIYTGTLLLLFPRDGKDDTAPSPFSLSFVTGLIFAGLLVWKFFQFYPALKRGVIFDYGVFSMGANRPLMPVIFLSLAVSAVYIFLTAGFALNTRKIFTWDYWRRTFNWRRLLTAAVVLGSLKVIIFNLARAHDARPFDYLLMNLLMTCNMQPGVFLVNHILSFGPVVILLALLWRPFCRLIRKQGAGLILCLLIVIFFSLDSESRKQMNTYPLLVPFLVKVTEGFDWKRWHYVLMLVLSLAFSKFWYTIAPMPWPGKAVEFPAQSFYMTMGPWMSHEMYFLQGGVVATAAVLIYFLYFFRRTFYPERVYA